MTHKPTEVETMFELGLMCPYCGSDNTTDIINHLATPEEEANCGDMFQCLDCHNTWENKSHEYVQGQPLTHKLTDTPAEYEFSRLTDLAQEIQTGAGPGKGAALAQALKIAKLQTEIADLREEKRELEGKLVQADAEIWRLSDILNRTIIEIENTRRWARVWKTVAKHWRIAAKDYLARWFDRGAEVGETRKWAKAWKQTAKRYRAMLLMFREYAIVNREWDDVKRIDQTLRRWGRV